MRGGWTYFFLGVCLTSLVTPLQALAALEDSQPEIEEIREKFLHTKSKVIEVERAERKILSTLYDINQQMKNMSKKRDSITNRMLTADINVKGIAKDIAALEKQLEEQQKILSAKLRTIYKLRASGVLPILFSSKSSHELDRLLKYLKIYSENDYKVIVEYQEDLKKLMKKRERLKVEVINLVNSRKDLQDQEKSLESKQNEKAQVLASLEKNKAIEIQRLELYRNKTLRILEKEGSSIEEVLDNSFFTMRGLLHPPVLGQLIKGYGVIEDPDQKYRLVHKGHFYMVPQGTEVRAIHKGVVEFSGVVQGYGNSLIIDHGDHYYTLYTHLSKTLVKKGQRVNRSHKIALSGDSSQRFGEGIYFEIRHFSDAIDPKSWIVSNFQLGDNR